MKSRLFKLLLPSLLLGLVISLIFMAQMGWKQHGDCSDNTTGLQSTHIRRTDCAGLQYGFPLRFLESKSQVNLGGFSEDGPSQVLIGVTSTTNLNELNLVLNTAFWATISLAVLLIIVPTTEPKQKKS